MRGKALWYVGPGAAELRDEPVGAPLPGEVTVRALFGAVSRGTERLVSAGRVPVSEYERMRAPMMAGTFPFPVKYGYATVGRVEGGEMELAGRVVFCLHPHQERVHGARRRVCCPFPMACRPRRAVLAANMETALNAVWDAAPGPADRIAVVGGGVVGLLLARLCARLPGAEVTLVDIAPGARRAGARARARASRRRMPRRAIAISSSTPAPPPPGWRPRCGSRATRRACVELSWYGSGEVAAPLGGAFHSRRLRLVSSQVGQVAPVAPPALDACTAAGGGARAARRSRARRAARARVAFADLPARLPVIFGPDCDVVCPLIGYPELST